MAEQRAKLSGTGHLHNVAQVLALRLNDAQARTQKSSGESPGKRGRDSLLYRHHFKRRRLQLAFEFLNKVEIAMSDR